jgi:NADH-quinone oxidoreductase subunit G
MTDSRVTLTIDGVSVTVPAGTVIVDAAKKAGIDIPVFCYHPKLGPVGMCRMCLVEIGRPRRDRATGQLIRGDDGQPVIDFNPKLETACTTPVGEGWVVRGLGENVEAGRREILEFLLTSHPLDCPICDKGGECPLQNLTMAHGPGKSRFLVDDKAHLAKRVPLGDLIVLDRERCIQCGRCVRFQEEIVGEPVIAFHERGRGLEIATFSEPGFDSIFSGNTADICPVGALTTTDFRFEARPWELRAAASICPHCPVGCNLTLNTRRQPDRDGRITVQRVMPRQNEAVNEIWICDKGRFAHHYAGSPARLGRPMVRRGDALVEVTWEEALSRAAEGLRAAGAKIVGIAGGRASNEDLFNFRRLVEGLGGRAVLDEWMAGGDLAQKVGAGSKADLGSMGAGDAILVVAADLHEEAPIWWLRVRQAAGRGAKLVVVSAVPTPLDALANAVLRVQAGGAPREVLEIVRDLRATSAASDSAGPRDEAVAALRGAEDVLVFFGREGLDHAGSAALAGACASLLSSLGRVGRPRSGLVPVWPRSNTQGAWDMGLRPDPGLGDVLAGAKAVVVMAADPLREDAQLAETLRGGPFLVVQELFLTATAKAADVVFPAQAFTEREGSFTSGDRRVQRFYPAVPPLPDARPDWQILADVAAALGVGLPGESAAGVAREIAASVPGYAGVTYEEMARVKPQWPVVGGEDLYYGGTAYRNEQGLGVKLLPAAERGEAFTPERPAAPEAQGQPPLSLLPVARLYDMGTTIAASDVLQAHLEPPTVALNPQDASRLGIGEGEAVEVRWDGRVSRLKARVKNSVPPGLALVPRSVSAGARGVSPVEVSRVG